MNTNLVKDSRAGDVFHYRWAARRCLKLLDNRTKLEKVVIEGSEEYTRKGEYVIDISEYYRDDNSENEIIRLYQLKHSNQNYGKHFTLTDIKKTLKGFAQRFEEHKKNKDKRKIEFYFISNRKVAENIKSSLQDITSNKVNNSKIHKSLINTIDLKGKQLLEFISLFEINDSEENYENQKFELRTEMAKLFAKIVDYRDIANIVELVQSKAVDKKNSSINKVDILQRFGASDEELLPAPSKLSELSNIIISKQYNILKEAITQLKYNKYILRAIGGVGKTVFCQYFFQNINSGDICLIYDCFGAGDYRRPSSGRHTHRVALSQMANELSMLGLCNPLIPQNEDDCRTLMLNFINRIQQCVEYLKTANRNATLYIFIDAADNAEMAANVLNENCFVSELLREEIPIGCKVIFTCRPERTVLLNPTSEVNLLELKPFSQLETKVHLSNLFSRVDDDVALEFCTLTQGNPRLQSKIIEQTPKSINELFEILKGSGKSLDEYFEIVLNNSILKLKELHNSKKYDEEIHALCIGIALLPPQIPLNILSEISSVSEDAIRSFVADFGTSIRIVDNYLQFRDEPTESWFKNNFSSSNNDKLKFIALLEPLVSQSSYASTFLFHLYLLVGKYDELIDIALSNKYLPSDNPVEERNSKLFRYQFAFKAALKKDNYSDAIKIAILAGEEFAGNDRQEKLYFNNIELLPHILDKEKILELAFKKKFKKEWQGSSFIYSASLLSNFEEYKGEAISFLRDADLWIEKQLEFEKQNKDEFQQIRIQNHDIAEIAFTILNVFGVKKCISYIKSWQPNTLIFDAIFIISKRLIDNGKAIVVVEILKLEYKNPFFVLPIINNLLEIGIRFNYPQFEHCLTKLIQIKMEIPFLRSEDKISNCIMSFLEVCIIQNLNTEKLRKVIEKYFPLTSSRLLIDSHFPEERNVFFRIIAIKEFLDEGVVTTNYAELVYKTEGEKYNNEIDAQRKKLDFFISKLLPWYKLRLSLLISQQPMGLLALVNQLYRTETKIPYYIEFDRTKREIIDVLISILSLCEFETKKNTKIIFENYIQGNLDCTTKQLLLLSRICNKTLHLKSIRLNADKLAFEKIKNFNSDKETDVIGDEYFELSKAVLNNSKNDAEFYFEEAISIVSRVGQEIVQRWESCVSLGQLCADSVHPQNQLAYRFIRCSEFIGLNLREKHWDRGEAIEVGTTMSPNIGIAYLSRWEDREIGHFEHLLYSVLKALIQTKAISTLEAWSFSEMLTSWYWKLLLNNCLDIETNVISKKLILDNAIDKFSKVGLEEKDWNSIFEIAQKHKLNIETLRKNWGLIKVNEKVANKSVVTPFFQKVSSKKLITKKPAHTIEGFNSLIVQLGDTRRFQLEIIVKKILENINEQEIDTFGETIIYSTAINEYEREILLSSFFHFYKERVSFNKLWKKLIYSYGYRQSSELLSNYQINHIIKILSLNTELKELLLNGIKDGIKEANTSLSSQKYFDFICVYSNKVGINELNNLFSFSLERFEKYIDNDFGDGIFTEQYNHNESVQASLAKFLFAKLGSPKQNLRWQTAHVIRNLAQFKCSIILSELTKCYFLEDIKPFIYFKYPFYKLHAKHFLLLAFDRISTENPNELIPFVKTICKIGTEEKHILIQNYCRRIIYKLTAHSPDLIIEECYKSILIVGQSNIPPVLENSKKNMVSYWHKNKLIPPKLDIHFGWDFERYWFEPLADIFDLPTKQAMEIAANIIYNEWNITNWEKYNDDPRLEIYNKYNNYDTYHSHGNYAKVDTLNFYYPFHALMSTAALLIDKMPIVLNDEDSNSTNIWNEWLNEHATNIEFWGADFRNYLPYPRPMWTYTEYTTDWETEYGELEITDSVNLNNEKGWFTVFGSWTERKDNRVEKYDIESALVCKEYSFDLLNALNSCDDKNDFKLPFYNEKYFEIHESDLILKGWIESIRIEGQFDKHDPNANEISYPHYRLAEPLMNALNIKCTSKKDEWVDLKSGEIQLKIINWCSEKIRHNESPEQEGMKIIASANLVKRLVEHYNLDLILEASIERNIKSEHNNKPKSKLFTINKNGKINKQQ